MPGRGVLCVASVALAFAFAVVYRGAGDNVPILAYSALLLQIGLLATYGARPGTTYRWSHAHSAALAYVVYLALTIFWSTLRENSFLMFWVLGALPFAFLVASQMERYRWILLFCALVAVGAASGLWGIAQFIGSGKRASGPLIDPNAWAAMLSMLFFGLLAQYLSRPRLGSRMARLCETFLFVLAVAFFAAYSRAATVVWLAAFLLLAAWLVVRTPVRRPLVIAIAISAVAFGLVHAYASQSEASHSEGYTLDVEAKGWSQRFAQWRSALEIYEEHPLTGSGLGTFKVQYPRHRTAGDLWTLGNYVHNDYLQFLQEGGPLLLAFLLALVAFLATALLRLTIIPGRAEGGHAARTEAVGLIIAMGTSLVHSLLTFTQYQLPIAMLTGVFLARLVAIGQGEWAPKLRGIRFTVPGPALALVLFLPWSMLAMDSLSYALVYGQGGVPFARAIREDPLRFHDTLQWLASVRRGTSVNHAALAVAYRKLMEQQEDPEYAHSLGVTAAIEYQRSLDANPFQYMVYVYYADLLDERPAIGEAREVRTDSTELLERAIEVAPIYLEPYTALAERYEARGERERAYRLLKEQALPWVDLEYWRYEEARLRFAARLLPLAREFGDSELIDALAPRVAEWETEWRRTH